MWAAAWLAVVALLELQQVGVLSSKAPVAAESVKHEEPYDYYAKPKYDYKYGVEDYKTGDHKSHWEKRDGDQVTGAYTVLEPDGTFRTVSYTANKDSGFNAVVTRHGKAAHPDAVVEHPVVHARPEAKHIRHQDHAVHLGVLDHAENQVVEAGPLHRLESPRIFEHNGESTRQVKRPSDEDTREIRAPTSVALNVVPAPRHFARINPSAKPAPFKHQIPAPAPAPLPSASPRKPAASTSDPAAPAAPAVRVPSYYGPSSAASAPQHQPYHKSVFEAQAHAFPSFSTSAGGALQTSGPGSASSFRTSSAAGSSSSAHSHGHKPSSAPSEPSSFTSHSNSFVSLSPSFPSAKPLSASRESRPFSRASVTGSSATGVGDDARGSGQGAGGVLETGFVPFRPLDELSHGSLALEHHDDHGARLYRHGTHDESQRSFVEVGMGGYPDSAYEYVNTAQ